MFSFDKRFVYVIIAIMALSFLTSMTSEKLLGLVLTIPGVLIAMTFHEYAHAKAADKLGDDTPRIQGRLRSEERRVGKECSEPCRSRWSPYH